MVTGLVLERDGNCGSVSREPVAVQIPEPLQRALSDLAESLGVTGLTVKRALSQILNVSFGNAAQA